MRWTPTLDMRIPNGMQGLRSVPAEEQSWTLREAVEDMKKRRLTRLFSRDEAGYAQLSDRLVTFGYAIDYGRTPTTGEVTAAYHFKICLQRPVFALYWYQQHKAQSAKRRIQERRKIMLRMSEALKDALVEAITEEDWDATSKQETLSLVYRTPNGTVIDLIDGIGHVSDINDITVPTELDADEELDGDVLNLVDLIKSAQATVLTTGEIITVYGTIDFFGLSRLAAFNSHV